MNRPRHRWNPDSEELASLELGDSVLANLELEEPSCLADEAVLVGARQALRRQPARTGPTLPLSLLRAFLASAAVLAVIVIIFFARGPSSHEMPGDRALPPGSDSSGQSLGLSADLKAAAVELVPEDASVEELFVVTGSLRGELTEMLFATRGLSEESLLPKSEIEARIQGCLADVVNVERRLAALEIER